MKMPEGKQQERPPRKAKMQLSGNSVSRDNTRSADNGEPGDVDNGAPLS